MPDDLKKTLKAMKQLERVFNILAGEGPVVIEVDGSVVPVNRTTIVFQGTNINLILVQGSDRQYRSVWGRFRFGKKQ